MSPVPALPELLRLLSPSAHRAILVRLAGRTADAETLARELNRDPEDIIACLDKLRLAALLTETAGDGPPLYAATDAVETVSTGGRCTLRLHAADGTLELSRPTS